MEDNAFVTGLTTENDIPQNIDEIETSIAESIDEKTQFQPRNRAERRALMKKAGKRGRRQLNTISETAKKLDYIELIQKLRELNEKKENENEAVKD